MRLGVHVSIAGGIQEAVVRATRLSCTTMQIFSRSPRGGTAAPLSPSECQRFDAERRAADLTPLAVHAPYIINLASPEATMWTRSVALYRDEYARATALNAQYLVTHVGSHRGAGEAAGIARVARAMTQTLAGRPQRPALRGHLDGGRSAGHRRKRERERGRTLHSAGPDAGGAVAGAAAADPRPPPRPAWYESRGGRWWRRGQERCEILNAVRRSLMTQIVKVDDTETSAKSFPQSAKSGALNKGTA